MEDILSGVQVKPITAFVEEKLNEENLLLEEEESKLKELQSSLSGHIQHQFQLNKSARQTSGVEDKILSSLRAYNGEYDPIDKSSIEAEGGSSIYMNITATKAKVAKSWITDIYRSVSDEAWSIEPTSNPELPKEITDAINNSVTSSVKKVSSGANTNPNPLDSRNQGSPSSTSISVNEAQSTISELNQEKRDLTALIAEEINKEAKFQNRIMEQQINDQLQEGGWENALNDFVDDFVIYPTAYMKGPVVTKKKKLKWKNGVPTTTYDYVFMNERVDPLDMYLSPSGKSLQDGDLIEHVRYNRRTLSELKGNSSYKVGAIERVLDNNGYAPWLDTSIESQKAASELRGSEYDMNKDIIHGLHYFGSVPVFKLREWGLDLFNYSNTDEVEVEAILVGNEVIKCSLNKDPLLRRPYYSASFYNRPGSLVGRSLPEMMRDIQRMCNATARALSNNLGIASGPMMEVYIDRLADDGDIEELKPMKIFQLVSDPTGGGGRAINFFQPQSNAAELLGVYEKFEEKADDVTGIPKYAYGNSQTAGAGSTATGISLILESATKVIKDAVRNIDIGLIKPRIEFQFYYNLIKNKDTIDFSGDVNIVPKGSSTLVVRAAQQLRRNEFLQITANPIDQEIMGTDGRASLLREIGDDLGLDSNPIPGPVALKRDKKKKEENAQAQMEAQAKEAQADRESGLAATSIQIEGQMKMHEQTQQFKAQELQVDTDQKEKDRQVNLMKAQTDAQLAEARIVSDKEKADNIEANKESLQVREIALKMQEGEGI